MYGASTKRVHQEQWCTKSLCALSLVLSGEQSRAVLVLVVMVMLLARNQQDDNEVVVVLADVEEEEETLTLSHLQMSGGGSVRLSSFFRQNSRF